MQPYVAREANKIREYVLNCGANHPSGKEICELLHGSSPLYRIYEKATDSAPSSLRQDRVKRSVSMVRCFQDSEPCTRESMIEITE